MKTQSPRTIVHSILAMPLLFLSTVSAVAITDLGLSPGPDVQTVGIDNHGQRPRVAQTAGQLRIRDAIHLVSP